MASTEKSSGRKKAAEGAAMGVHPTGENGGGDPPPEEADPRTGNEAGQPR
jgi:hypothetical protein